MPFFGLLSIYLPFSGRPRPGGKKPEAPGNRTGRKSQFPTAALLRYSTFQTQIFRRKEKSPAGKTKPAWSSRSKGGWLRPKPKPAIAEGPIAPGSGPVRRRYPSSPPTRNPLPFCLPANGPLPDSPGRRRQESKEIKVLKMQALLKQHLKQWKKT